MRRKEIKAITEWIWLHDEVQRRREEGD
jgi:hypothetical protein